jgi:hypothetical protein
MALSAAEAIQGIHAQAGPEVQASALNHDLLSQTASAHRMGPERFNQIFKMASRPDVQLRFNNLFPNIANDPRSQALYLEMREGVFEGDYIDCFDILKEAYGRPTPIEVYNAKSDQNLDIQAESDAICTKPLTEEPTNYIG